MKFDFTEGEWVIQENGDVVSVNQDSDFDEDTGNYYYVKTIAYDEGILGSGNDEEKANARLISKAPEMLNALIYSLKLFYMMKKDRDTLIKMDETHVKAFEEIKDIIEQATGKTWEDIK